MHTNVMSFTVSKSVGISFHIRAHRNQITFSLSVHVGSTTSRKAETEWSVDKYIATVRRLLATKQGSCCSNKLLWTSDRSARCDHSPRAAGAHLKYQRMSLTLEVWNAFIYLSNSTTVQLYQLTQSFRKLLHSYQWTYWLSVQLTFNRLSEATLC